MPIWAGVFFRLGNPSNHLDLPDLSAGGRIDQSGGTGAEDEAADAIVGINSH